MRLSLTPDPNIDNWHFAEIWIDPMQSPPYLLMLFSDATGNCSIHDPVANYQLVFSSTTYEEAKDWLLEDEYEPVEGRLFASDL